MKQQDHLMGLQLISKESMVSTSNETRLPLRYDTQHGMVYIPF